MQADPNLARITAYMPNMIPIAYLNDSFINCNENLAWGKAEPHVQPYMFWYKTEGEKLVKTSFYIQ